MYNRDLDSQPIAHWFQIPVVFPMEVIIKSTADIITVPTNIFDTFVFDPIETLTLSIHSLTKQHNTLRNLTQTHFRKLTKLRQLVLAGNNMQMLDTNIFAPLTQLNCLNLSQNEIVELPPNLFANQHQLIVLDLSYNSLTYLTPELFNQTPLLWQLKLTGNRLHNTTNLKETLKPLPYLYRLDLSKNKLQSNRGSENYLHFGYDKIGECLAIVKIQNSISKLQAENYEGNNINLREIDLSHNRLSQFNMDWLVKSSVKCLLKINLEHNLITNIYALSSLLTTTDNCEREIKLSGNPVVCDCTLAWIYNGNYQRLLSDLQCNQTSTKQLTDIAQLRRDELCAWQPVLCPSKCVCYTKSEFLTINCNGRELDVIEKLPRPEQVALTTTILDISSNKFTSLLPNITFGYANVSKLYASNNKIFNISLFELPTNLTVLDLRNNRLKSLSADFLRAFLNESTKLQFLNLSENPWFCDCAAQQLLYTIRAHRQRIPDVEQLRCDNLQNDTLLTANVSELCQTDIKVKHYKYLTVAVTSAASLIIILLLIIALFYKYNLQVKVWLYSRNILSCCINEHELDKNKTFDAFISYAHQEADFVNQTLLPQLEQCEPPFRICTHERNWLAGAYIPEQIIESVEQSRRTIIVLSQHFIESEWARMEFRTAHQCSLNEGRARIIMIKYGEIINSGLLDKELKA
ncbi:protein toll-like [Bactrocera oleae]|uniref:protein toll-like n=1 Tax=Bactrocera oleae TaxID=104688 RepID=UPI00387EB616